MTNNLEHFTHDEFDSPDRINTGKLMNYEFLLKLDKARYIANITFKITSGYRTVKHNKEVGGVSNSSHLHGLAADISATTSSQKFIIVNALLKVGFTRIGIGNTFIHVDLDKTKNQNVMWTY